MSELDLLNVLLTPARIAEAEEHRNQLIQREHEERRAWHAEDAARSQTVVDAIAAEAEPVMHVAEPPSAPEPHGDFRSEIPYSVDEQPMENYWSRPRTFTGEQLARALGPASFRMGMTAPDFAAQVIATLPNQGIPQDGPEPPDEEDSDTFVRPERVNDAVRLMEGQIARGEKPRIPPDWTERWAAVPPPAQTFMPPPADPSRREVKDSIDAIGEAELVFLGRIADSLEVIARSIPPEPTDEERREAEAERERAVLVLYDVLRGH